MPQPAVDHHRLVEWLEAVRQHLRTLRVWEVLSLEGLDTVDVMLSPLFMATLSELRRGGGGQPRGAVGRLSDLIKQQGYRLKQALAERRACLQSAAPQADRRFALAPRHSALCRSRPGERRAGRRGPAIRSHGLQSEGLSTVAGPWSAAVLFAAGVARRAASLRGATPSGACEQLGDLPMPSLPLYRQEGIERDLSAIYWATWAEALPLVCEAVANAGGAGDNFAQAARCRQRHHVRRASRLPGRPATKRADGGLASRP